MVEGSDDPEKGFWNRWAHGSSAGPVPVAVAGLAIVPCCSTTASSSTRATPRPRTCPAPGDGARGSRGAPRSRRSPTACTCPSRSSSRGTTTPAQLEQVASQRRRDARDRRRFRAAAAGAEGARARRGDVDDRRLARRSAGGDSELQDDVVPAIEDELGGPQATLAGLPTSESREFVARRLRQVPVRAAVRRAAHLRAADAGVQVGRCCRSRP